MIQFFSFVLKQTKCLPETESQHCVKVLRMKQGDRIVVTDGKGYRYQCTIVDPHHKHVYVNIDAEEEIACHWGCTIAVAVAPTKNMDRMEWFAEKATEAGIDRVVPLKCAHSERKELKTERLRKILVSAMNQSLKTTLPQLDEMTKFETLVKADFDGQKFIGYCDDALPRKSFVKEYKPGSNVLILIGPEGDFSPQEVELAMNHGFVPVTFGDSRFRTESAALFGVNAVHAINQLTK